MKITKIRVGEKKFDLSEAFYGVSLEDVNWACDGGLNANMVRNHSFDAFFLSPETTEASLLAKKAPSYQYDYLRYWNTDGLTLRSFLEDGASPSSRYVRVTVQHWGTLENLGYNGGGLAADKPAMFVNEGDSYVFSCYIRNIDYEGSVRVCCEDASGEPLTELEEVPFSYDWTRRELSVTGVKSGCGKLCLDFDGAGRIDLDCVVFRPAKVWGAGDPKWTEGFFRRDLVESLARLKPRFLRFPAGRICEGLGGGNEYDWKHSVGRTVDRSGMPSLWGMRLSDRGAWQSLQLGFYEFFCLCEDLGMEPVPTVWAGLGTGKYSSFCLPADSAEFDERVTAGILDLLEFACAEEGAGEWSGLRAAMGHPAPFGLKYLSIGSSATGLAYREAFGRLQAKIAERYPAVRLILAAGTPGSDTCAENRAFAAQFAGVLIDEHLRREPAELCRGREIFASCEGPEVFLSEYSAHDPAVPVAANTFSSALAEAVFLTGCEQHADKVRMLSYAPLLALAGSAQLPHSMIVFNPEYVLKTANYQVQELFSAHVGSFVPETEILGKKDRLPKNVYCSVTEDEDRVYLKLVNAGLMPAGLQIDLPFTRGEAKLYLYRSLRGGRANSLRFDGEPKYALTLKEEDYSVFDGSLGMYLRGRTVMTVVIEKDKEH